MNKIYIQMFIFILFILFFLFDVGLSELTFVKNLVILSVLLLNFIVNVKLESTFITIFVLAGFLFDWYNKNLLGLSSLVLVITLYMYYLLIIRFRGNKLVLYLINYVFNLILIQCFLGFSLESHFLIQSSVGALIHTSLSLFWWGKKWSVV